MNYKNFLFVCTVFCLMIAVPKSSLAQSSRLPQLRLAVSTATPHNTPLWVAKDKKIFDKYGVDVQMIFVMGGALVSQMLAAGEIQVAANAKVYDSFVRAVVEGYAYVFNKDNKQAVKEVIAKNLRLPNAEAAEDFYIEAQEVLDRKPYPTVDGTRTVIKFVTEQNPKVASVKAERIVDASWLKKLDDEGFFEKLYKGK